MNEPLTCPLMICQSYDCIAHNICPFQIGLFRQLYNVKVLFTYCCSYVNEFLSGTFPSDSVHRVVKSFNTDCDSVLYHFPDYDDLYPSVPNLPSVVSAPVKDFTCCAKSASDAETSVALNLQSTSNHWHHHHRYHTHKHASFCLI